MQKVGNHEIVSTRPKHSESFGPVARRLDLEALSPQNFSDQFTKSYLVIY